jgi:hypothetical protein
MNDLLNTPSLIGATVLVRHDQRRLDGPKYPGRTGVVTEENRFGRPEGLWHIRLAATNRAKERTALFWTGDLDVLEWPSRDESTSVQIPL